MVAAGRQVWAEPRLWYVVAIWALFAGAITRSRRTDPVAVSPGSILRAAPWIVAAVLIQLLSWAGGFPQVSRLAVPLALIGFTTGLLGIPLRVSALALLCLPPPHFLTHWVGLDLADLWARIAGAVVEGAGNVPRSTWDGGVRTLALTGAFVWSHWSVKPGPVNRLALGLLAALGLTVAAQVLTFVVAGVLSTDLAAIWLVHLCWMVVLGVCFVVPGIRPGSYAETIHAD